eukprot:746304-Hanusia_phi.AAC.2
MSSTQDGGSSYRVLGSTFQVSQTALFGQLDDMLWNQLRLGISMPKSSLRAVTKGEDIPVCGKLNDTGRIQEKQSPIREKGAVALATRYLPDRSC